MAGRASNCCAPACCHCEPAKLHREPGRTWLRNPTVVLRTDKADRRLRRSAKLRYEFFSADWTPWPVFSKIRARWPRLVFEVRPDYRRD